MSEQKYPDIRLLLLSILKSLDDDSLCNSSKIENISSSCEDNIVGLSSTAIESDAIEELELWRTMEKHLKNYGELWRTHEEQWKTMKNNEELWRNRKMLKVSL